MDIKREGVAKKKIFRRVIYLTIAAVAVAVAGWRVSQLKPAAPAVEIATIWPDTVKRGPMVRDVRGLGTLVPEDILWIQAAFDSQVSKIHTQSGDEVGPETVLLVLTNPQMEADEIDYEWHNEGGFPIEDDWARSDPGLFHLVFDNGQVRVYTVVLPQDSRR